MRDGAFAHLDVPLRPLEAHDLRTLRPQVEPCVNRYIAIFEQGRMYIGHVPAVFPAQNAAHRHGPLRSLIQVQREHDPADHVHQQIARNPGAVLLPAAPAREKQRIERAFRSSPLPHVPVECLGRKVGRRWILPGSRGIVASQRALHQAQVSNRPLREQFFRLPVNRRTHTLRSDLHELSRLLLRRRHIEAIGDRMRHRFLAVDILARIHGIHDDLAMPVIRNCRDQAVDLLIVEQFLVAPRRREGGVHDLFRERMPAVV